MNAIYNPKFLKIGIDVGSQNHSIAISNEKDEIIEEFDIKHTQNGFDILFNQIDKYNKDHQYEVQIAMEGYNGWARPLDQKILQKGYTLYNVNNVKLARFKEIFSNNSKTDTIDARKILQLLVMKRHLPMTDDVLQEVHISQVIHPQLKKLTRRRKQLIKEKLSLCNRLSSDLSAMAPELRALSKTIDSLWYLRFLSSKKDLRLLAKVKLQTILKIKNIGSKFANKIIQWQNSSPYLSNELDYIAPMIYEDVVRILELMDKIKNLQKEIESLIPKSNIAKYMQTIPGFGSISSAELAGEIDNIKRFKNEGSLALYLGMTNVDNSSGKSQGSKRALNVNRHAKMAIVTATMKHCMYNEESKKYLQKKISEGKRYQQAIRSMGRHLVRVIWNMIKNQRDYEIRK